MCSRRHNLFIYFLCFLVCFVVFHEGFFRCMNSGQASIVGESVGRALDISVYSDRRNYHNYKYCKSSSEAPKSSFSTALDASYFLAAALKRPNLAISVPQMNSVAPFSPHHQLKYLCNKTNLNVKQVRYLPSRLPLQSHLLCPPFLQTSLPLSLGPLFLSHPPPSSFTASPDRPRVCNLVLITTSD